jgi:hypothetical protein
LIIVLLTIFGLNENNTGRSTNYDLTMSGQSGIEPHGREYRTKLARSPIASNVGMVPSQPTMSFD